MLSTRMGGAAARGVVGVAAETWSGKQVLVLVPCVFSACPELDEGRK